MSRNKCNVDSSSVGKSDICESNEVKEKTISEVRNVNKKKEKSEIHVIKEEDKSIEINNKNFEVSEKKINVTKSGQNKVENVLKISEKSVECDVQCNMEDECVKILTLKDKSKSDELLCNAKLDLKRKRKEDENIKTENCIEEESEVSLSNKNIIVKSEMHESNKCNVIKKLKINDMCDENCNESNRNEIIISEIVIRRNQEVNVTNVNELEMCDIENNAVNKKFIRSYLTSDVLHGDSYNRKEVITSEIILPVKNINKESKHIQAEKQVTEKDPNNLLNNDIKNMYQKSEVKNNFNIKTVPNIISEIVCDIAEKSNISKVIDSDIQDFKDNVKEKSVE